MHSTPFLNDSIWRNAACYLRPMKIVSYQSLWSLLGASLCKSAWMRMRL